MADEQSKPRVPGDVAELRAFLEQYLRIEKLGCNDGPDRGFLAVPKGLELKSVKSFVDEWLEAPRRREGTAIMHDLDSFILHVGRFCDDHSAIFARASPSLTEASLLGVLDYHEQHASGKPRFGRHRSSYAFPLSESWLIWNKAGNSVFSQADFAAFLEQHICDVQAMPEFLTGNGDGKPAKRAPEHSLSDAEQRIVTLAAQLEAHPCGPSGLLELARGLAVHESSKASEFVNLKSGERSITFQIEHKNEAGEKLKVPDLFFIGIPVFEAGEAYRIPVRLSYRINRGTGVISWRVAMYRPDVVFASAFTEAVAKVREALKLPVFIGEPEPMQKA